MSEEDVDGLFAALKLSVYRALDDAKVKVDTRRAFDRDLERIRALPETEERHG